MYHPICFRAKTEEELKIVPDKLFSNLEQITKYIANKIRFWWSKSNGISWRRNIRCSKCRNFYICENSRKKNNFNEDENELNEKIIDGDLELLRIDDEENNKYLKKLEIIVTYQVVNIEEPLIKFVI